MATSPPSLNANAKRDPTVSSRMPPSLNQLAARISASGNPVPTPSSTSSSASRPRLAAQLLRTGSSVSVTSSAAASVADSTAVQPPDSTRAGSPANSSSRASSPPESVRSITNANANANGNTNGSNGADGGGEPLTAERLEKLGSNSDGGSGEKKVKMGYKNIPSLDAITARLAMARTLSIDGSPKPPEPETFEDPSTPGVPQKAPEHPLQHSWTMYYDTKAKIPFTPTPANTDNNASNAPNSATNPGAPITLETDDYEAGLSIIGEFETVESFCRYFNWLKPPSKLERNSNYHLFKTGIKPMWEDEANAHGGKWVLTMKNNPQLLDRCWSWLSMALVGEELDEGDDEICGAVVSLRSKVDRIQLWIRGKEDVEKVNGIGKRLVKMLDVNEGDGIGLEFQYNSDDRPPPNKYLSIHSFPSSSFRSSFGSGAGAGHQHSHSASGPGSAPSSAHPLGLGDGGPMSAGPGGAFGGFGIGIGAGGGGGGGAFGSGGVGGGGGGSSGWRGGSGSGGKRG